MDRMVAAKSWVSKTDLARYSRCPYAFWLIDSRFGRKDLTLYGVPLFKNKNLRIVGIPDAIETAGGACTPSR